MHYDTALFYVLNGWTVSPVVGGFVYIVAKFLPWIFLILFLAWALSAIDVGRRNLLVIPLAVAFFARFVVGTVLKELIMRPRPFIDLPGVHQLIPESGYALPSGHATFFFALAFSIYMIDKAKGKQFIILAALLSLARIFAGVHYPADILAGALLGVSVSYLLFKFRLSRYFEKK